MGHSFRMAPMPFWHVPTLLLFSFFYFPNVSLPSAGRYNGFHFSAAPPVSAEGWACAVVTAYSGSHSTMCAFPSQWPMKAHWWMENKKAEEGADPLLLLCHMPPGPCVCLSSFNFDRISSLQIQESNYLLSQYRAVVRNILASSATCLGWEDFDSSRLE